MSFKAIKCPNCGSALQPPPNAATVPCSHCGYQIQLRETINVHHTNLPTTENLMMLADNSYEGKNFAEAHSYFSQVVSIEPENVYAWMGRASSAGWQSTLAADRIPECITSYKQAFSLGMSEDEKAGAAADLREISAAFFDLAWGHMKEFREDNVHLGGNFLENMADIAKDKNWNKGLVAELLDATEKCYNCLDLALIIKPEVETADMGIRIGNMILTLNEINKEVKQIVNDYISKYEQKAKELNPNYQKPAKSGCFVITATMGSPFDSNVLLLQNFRDAVLLDSGLGKSIVSTYYKIGPMFAAIIRPSRILRMISCAIIVKPAAFVAKWVLDHRRSPVK